jgi:L-aspartate oxidase
MSILRSDFIIIGSGLAGLSSALYASKFGKVTLLTKSTLDVSNSFWAQGGIAAAIGSDDSPGYHFEDTIKAGAELCNKEAVHILVTEGVDRVKELIETGMSFDKENGVIALGLEGNHSRRRVLHASGDATGREVIRFLIEKMRDNENIEVYENSLVFELIVQDKICTGVQAYHWDRKISGTFTAPSIILATGGASGMYSRTTNPHSTTGDGISLAYNAGAEISNMEFVQFHPSSLLLDSGETFLISEAIRGEGAYLVNSSGERFMTGVHERAELAPRDIVAHEMFKQYLRENNKVFLKLDHLDKNKIRKRFANIYEEVIKHGIDITKDPIPVAPAAHYLIGGVRTGLWGETNIKNLYAVGEVACTGVHGANRLASNSLLECLVFGKRTIDYSKNSGTQPVNKEFIQPEYRVDKSKETIYLEYKNQIAEILTNNVGIVRDEQGLETAIKLYDEIDSLFNYSEFEYYSLRLKSLLSVVRLITYSALLRKESRGGHKRSDYPMPNGKFLSETIFTINNEPSQEMIN